MPKLENQKEVMALLQEPFAPEDIEWRINMAGYTKNGGIYAQLLAYVTNRAIQERLDNAVGIGEWKNTFSSAPDGGVLCGISVLWGNEWVDKYDGAENTQFEAVKGGLSGAMKRAAVQWGIGRYLYKLDATFVNAQKDKPSDMTGWVRASAKLKKEDPYQTTFYYKLPILPDWAKSN